MSSPLRYDVDTIATLMSTELNSFATAGQKIATVATYDNRTKLFLWGDFELTISYAIAPTAGTAIHLYIVPSIDGAYEDASDSIVPAAVLYVGAFVLRNVTGAQIVPLPKVPLPPHLFKLVAIAGTTGQTAAASGNLIKLLAYSEKVG